MLSMAQIKNGKDGTGFVFHNEINEKFLYKQLTTGEHCLFVWSDMLGWTLSKQITEEHVKKFRERKIKNYTDSPYHQHVGVLEPETLVMDEMVVSYDHLLIPRIRILAPVPTFIHKIGDIITYDRGFGLDRDNEVGISLTLEQIGTYKHLFRLLNWYEYRKIEELPPYIAIDSPHDITAAVFKVDRWEDDLSIMPISDDAENERMMNRILSIDWHFYSAYSKPASIYQYNSYLVTGLQKRAAELGRPITSAKQK